MPRRAAISSSLARTSSDISIVVPHGSNLHACACICNAENESSGLEGTALVFPGVFFGEKLSPAVTPASPVSGGSGP